MKRGRGARREETGAGLSRCSKSLPRAHCHGCNTKGQRSLLQRRRVAASARRVLPQVSRLDVTFDSHHRCQHLLAARPQTLVRHLQGVLSKESHRQRPAPPRLPPFPPTVSFLSPCASAAPDPQTAPDPAPCPSPRRGVWPCRCPAPLPVRRRRGFRRRGRRSSSRCCRCPRARSPRHRRSVELEERKHEKHPAELSKFL